MLMELLVQYYERIFYTPKILILRGLLSVADLSLKVMNSVEGTCVMNSIFNVTW